MATPPAPATAERPSVTDDMWVPDVLAVAKLRDAAESALVTRLHARLAALLGRSFETATPDTVRALVADRIGALLAEDGVTLNRSDRLRIQEAVLGEILGYGPIQDLLDDDSISEVMVNGPKQVWIEREGKLFVTDVQFNDADHVVRVIQRIVAPLGRR